MPSRASRPIRPYITAIIPAAGCGNRMSYGRDKLFLKISGKDIITYSLKVLQASSVINEIIVAASTYNIGRIERISKVHNIKKLRNVILGGEKRSISVLNAFLHIGKRTDIVLIHDAARPFLTKNLIKDVAQAAEDFGAAIAAVPLKPTIKQVGKDAHFVKKTLERKILWEAQTPQAFKKGILTKAYNSKKAYISKFTDEASLIEALGRKVRVVRGSYKNIKVTTKEDLAIAKAIAGSGRLR
jgi:2-C-methyl-D-erythritol 4-phosphate cytidylyltransferase